ncbi:helix-turn-helix transcriptional regulator [Vibrio hangzhouensis]|nr:helix-turn-helix transcriptional regulator [Vibrio hangzhouensis]
MNFSLVSKQSVEIFASMFKDIDSSTYTLLRAATIPNNIHEDVDYEYLPESCLKNFFEVLSQRVSADKAGWLFLRTCKEVYVPKSIAAISNRDSLKSALDEFCERLKLQSTAANIYLENKGNSWWLVREKSGLEEKWFNYAEMFSVIGMAEVLRALTNDQWYPTRIGIQSSHIDEFSSLPSLERAQFFIERPVTALEIPESLLNMPVVVPTTNSLLGAQAVPDFSSMSFSEQLTLAISPYLSMGKLPIKLAAEILRMNVRTLQRKLSAENIVYKSFIERLVFDEVKKRLRETDEPITRLANRFGYSDSAHFSRSFKRIFGLTPSAFRLSSRYSRVHHANRV